MNITEKINTLTHAELKQLCIEQNGTALDLMQQLAQKEAQRKEAFKALLELNKIEQRQKAQLIKAGELASVCLTLVQDNALLRQYEAFVEVLNEFDNFK